MKRNELESSVESVERDERLIERCSDMMLKKIER